MSVPMDAGPARSDRRESAGDRWEDHPPLVRQEAGSGGHLVQAWASENGLTLGQVACKEKSNEITATMELLKLLDLKS